MTDGFRGADFRSFSNYRNQVWASKESDGRAIFSRIYEPNQLCTVEIFFRDLLFKKSEDYVNFLWISLHQLIQIAIENDLSNRTTTLEEGEVGIPIV